MNVIERLGNVLPHPFWLFAVLSVVLGLVSWLLSGLQVSAVNPATGKAIAIQNLLSTEGMRDAVNGVVKNYMAFPPLGIALVTMIGVGLADQTGLLTTVLRASVIRVPRRLVTFALAFTGMVAHVAADAGYIVLIPLGAIIFRAIGRSPVLGILVALVSISAGTDASPLLTPTDVLLSGLTTAAAHTIDPSYVVTPVANYYFSLVSSIVLSLVITFAVEGFIAKRVEGEEDLDVDHDEGELQLSPAQRRGLRNAGIAAVVYLVALVALCIPRSSPLRAKGGGLLDSPLMTGVAIVLSLFFLVVGIAYGIAVGRIRKSQDVPDLIGAGLRDITPLLVLFFAVSQFLAFFKWTKIGEVMAIRGAELLRASGAHPLVILLGMLVIVSIINLFITSGSAMWSLVGPVFVPMLMLLGISPEVTQAVYRIADSCTNIATPMSPYFVMALGFIQKYRPHAGIGTLAALTIPLALCMLVAWALLLLGWWVVGAPLGPGAPIR